MNPDSNLEIRNLSLFEHKKVLQNLDAFWLSRTELIRPHHHALFSLLYADSSYVLYQNSEIVSYLYAAYNKNKAFIHILATRPHYYQHGYAATLLAHFETRLKLKKLKSIWAYIVPGNIRSQIFFEKSGFIMRKEIFISTDEKRVLYKKSL